MSVTISSINKYQKASSFCTEYDALYNEMSTKPDATNAAYQNTMVKDLVDGGYWSGPDVYMELFYVVALHDQTEASLNWVTPGSFTITDPGATTPTWTQYQGYTGNGSSDYLSSTWRPYDDMSANLSLNNISIGAWSTADATDTTNAIMGVTGTNRLRIMPRNSNVMQSVLSNTTSLDTANSTTTGLLMTTRTASNAVENFKNGSSLGTGSSASVGLPTTGRALYLLAHNNAGTANQFWHNQVALWLVCSGVTEAQHLAMYNIIHTYMTAIGL